MKILDILNEMHDSEIIRVKSILTSFMRENGYNFIITNHAQFDSFFRRIDIEPSDVINTLIGLFRTPKWLKITKEAKETRNELEAVVTNYNTYLNLVFSIDFDRNPSSSNTGSGSLRYNFKLMTGIVSPDFKTDNMREKTVRFGVRA